jgi:hypothetical protein
MINGRARSSARLAAAEHITPSSLLTVIVALGVVAIYRIGHGTTFFYDEWDFALTRRPWTAATLLVPHNEHLSLIPVLVYKTLFAVVGLHSYGAYRLTLLAFHVACVVLTFVLVRRRLGGWIALATATILMFLGSGYPELLWPIHIGYLGSLAGGLAMMAALDRTSPSAYLAAMFALAFALASSSFGLPLAAGAIAELVLRREKRRLWVVFAPLAAWAIWFVRYGKTGSPPAENLARTPRYIAEMFATSVGGVTGLGRYAGVAVGIIFATLVAVRIRRSGVSPRLAFLLTMLISFWIFAAVERAHLVPSIDPKWVYPNAILLLLIGAEIGAGAHIVRRVSLVGAVIAAIAVASNTVQLIHGGEHLRGISTRIRAELAALQLARDHVDPQYQPDVVDAPQVIAGPYLTAIRALGSPADSVQSLPTLPADTRTSVDRVLLEASHPSLSPMAGQLDTVAPRVDAVTGGTIVTLGPCVVFRATRSNTAVVALTVPPRGLRVSADRGTGVVRLRRFADGYSPLVIGTVTSDRQSLDPPRDASPTPWHVRLETSGAVRSCSLRVRSS